MCNPAVDQHGSLVLSFNYYTLFDLVLVSIWFNSCLFLVYLFLGYSDLNPEFGTDLGPGLSPILVLGPIPIF